TVLADFHEQDQVDLGFDNVGNLPACRLADRLYGLAALAEHDFALAFALDVDRLLDANIARAQFLPDFGFHRRVIRQFLVQPLEQLFARDLRGELADWRVRHLLGRIEPWPRRNALRQPDFEIHDAVAGQRGNHEREFKLCGLVGVIRQGQQRFLGDDIDLVEHQQFRRFDVAELTQNVLLLLVEALARIDDDAHEIGLVRPAPGPWHHRAVEPPARRKNAWRVDEDQLRSFLDGDPADQRARRLHLVRDDADLRTHQRVEQRRLAGVGRTDQSNEAAMRLAILRVRISHQACPPTRRHA